MAVLTFGNGYSCDPKTLEYQRYDMDREDGTGNDQSGNMWRDRAGIKVKLVCTFPPLYSSDISKLLQAVKDVNFTIKYPDAYTGAYRTSTFYVGDRSAPIYAYDEAKGEWLWEGLSMNFIEWYAQ